MDACPDRTVPALLTVLHLLLQTSGTLCYHPPLQDTPLNPHDVALSRDLCPRSLNKGQGFYIGSPTIHPVVRHSELSYLFACRGVNTGLQCLDSYLQRCMKEENRHHLDSKLNRLKELMKKRCEPGPHQEGRWPYHGRG